jgi:hypothetical protein
MQQVHQQQTKAGCQSFKHKILHQSQVIVRKLAEVLRYYGKNAFNLRKAFGNRERSRQPFISATVTVNLTPAHFLFHATDQEYRQQ